MEEAKEMNEDKEATARREIRKVPVLAPDINGWRKWWSWCWW